MPLAPSPSMTRSGASHSTRSGAKLLDFGLVKQATPAVTVGASPDDATATTGLTGRGAILGTLHYMSPEQVRQKPLDRRADVFAAGDAAYLKLLTAAVAAATRRGELSPKRHGLTAAAAAGLLMAGAHGLGTDPAHPLSADEHRTQLAALVRVMVAGLAPA